MIKFDLKKIQLPAITAKLFSVKNQQDLFVVSFPSLTVKWAHATKNAEDEIIFHQFQEKKFAENANADTEISQYLTGTFSELKIAHKNVIAVIPSSFFISKNVDMPSNDLEEISKIIDLQAGRYTPYSRDEIVIDYICMDNAGQHYTNVLLFIVNRKLVDRYFSVLHKAGLTIDRIAIASEGMGLSYDQVFSEAKSEKNAIGGVYIGEDAADLTIVDKHQMVFVRSIPIGSEHFQKNREKARDEFASEMKKSLAAYLDQGVGRPVKELVVTGVIKGLEFLEPTARDIHPDLSLKFVKDTAFFTLEKSKTERGEIGPEGSFFEVMACLNAAALLKIDLSPREIKLKRHTLEGGKEIITLGVLIMLVMVLICFFLASKVYMKREIISKYETIEGASADKARLLERASTKARVVKTLLKNRGKGLYVFDRLTSLIGEDIYLSSFSYDREGNLAIAGTANSMSRVYAFVTDLEESNYFSAVKTKSTKSRKVGTSDVADFELECTIAESR